MVAPGATTTYHVMGMTQLSGCSATDSATVSVAPQPTPALGPDRAVCPGDSVLLAVLAPDPTATYVWTGAGLSTTAGPTVMARPTATTAYVVTAASQQTGCTATDTVAVRVAVVPAATLTVADTLLVGQSASFGVTLTPAGTLATTAWEFGDGTTSADPAPTHIYAAAGTYVAQVRGTTAEGCAVETTATVVVKVPRPSCSPTSSRPITTASTTPSSRT